MHNFTSLDHPEVISFGNGHTTPALGTGVMELTPIVNGQRSVIQLRNVLYAPGCTYGNLFSVKHATRAGARIIFNDTTCDITSGGNLVAQATCVGDDLYTITALQRAETALISAVKESSQLWHRRYGHLGYGSLAKLVKQDMVTGINLSEQDFNNTKELCEPCELGKQHRQPFPSSTTKTTKPLELVHMDVCGPMQVKSTGGNRYLATFLDDNTGLSVVRPLPYKSDVPAEVKLVFNMLEAQSGLRVLTVRTDRGGEYLNHTLEKFFTDKGIIHQTTAPHTPEQNGAAERFNRTIIERTRAMLLDAELPKSLWAEAATTANYLRNRSPSLNRTKTPWELFYNNKPDVSNLRVFGSTVYVHVPKALRRKLDPVSFKGKLVGYEPNSKAYRVLVDSTNKISVSRDITFSEIVSAEEPTVE